MPTIRRAIAAMGTRFEVVLDGPDEAFLADVAALAMEQIEELHRRFSLFSRDSLVSYINREAHTEPVRLDRDTFELFADCLAVWRESGGAFDITVAPLMAALGFREQGDRGGESTVAGNAVVEPKSEDPPPQIGSDAIELDSVACTIRFTRPGIAIDLGAIAKGHALDLAAAVLREHGIKRAFIHGGTSSVVAIGAPPGEPGWRVSIAPPSMDGTSEPAPTPTLLLNDMSLSVSAPHGRVIRRDDRWIGHVIDPRTRLPVTAAATAVVVGPSARLADAWSTAALVLGGRPENLPPEYPSLVLSAPASNDQGSGHGGGGPAATWIVEGPAFVEFAPASTPLARETPV